jgi:hypothetical protein
LVRIPIQPSSLEYNFMSHERCAGEGELLLRLTEHGAMLTEQGRDVNSGFLRVLAKQRARLFECGVQIASKCHPLGRVSTGRKVAVPNSSLIGVDSPLPRSPFATHYSSLSFRL